MCFSSPGTASPPQLIWRHICCKYSPWTPDVPPPLKRLGPLSQLEGSSRPQGPRLGMQAPPRLPSHVEGIIHSHSYSQGEQTRTMHLISCTPTPEGSGRGRGKTQKRSEAMSFKGLNKYVTCPPSGAPLLFPKYWVAGEGAAVLGDGGGCVCVRSGVTPPAKGELGNTCHLLWLQA